LREVGDGRFRGAVDRRLPALEARRQTAHRETAQACGQQGPELPNQVIQVRRHHKDARGAITDDVRNFFGQQARADRCVVNAGTVGPETRLEQAPVVLHQQGHMRAPCDAAATQYVRHPVGP
jgi:hypothetical protein